MKNANSILVGALMVLSMSAYAGSVNSNVNTYTEEKRNVAVAVKDLPANIEAIESPAPQKAVVTAPKEQTPVQKAALVELELKSVAKK